MKRKVKVTQSDKEPVPTEVLASAIVSMAQGVRALRRGRLNDRALFMLIADAAPLIKGHRPHRPVGIRDVKAVLEGIDALEKTFLRKTS